jgi:hypothetical protein
MCARGKVCRFRCCLLLKCCAVVSAWTPLNTVDIFNATSGVWSTAVLSVARWSPAATSLPNDGLAMFAGGGGAQYVLIIMIARDGVWGGG